MGRGFFKPYRGPAASIFFLVLCRGRDRIPTDRAFFPSLKLKMDGWNTIVSLWEARPIFRCELLVSGSIHAIIRYSGFFGVLSVGPVGHFLDSGKLWEQNIETI